MIKNHLKELADYYFESFFDKHDIDNISLESGLKLLAEEV